MCVWILFIYKHEEKENLQWKFLTLSMWTGGYFKGWRVRGYTEAYACMQIYQDISDWKVNKIPEVLFDFPKLLNVIFNDDEWGNVFKEKGCLSKKRIICV